MKKGCPISPDEIPVAKSELVPAEVFDVVNELLVRKSTGNNSITILQKEIVAEIRKRMSDCKVEWLNFEDAYRASGWVVGYDRADYCETSASFMFLKTAAPSFHNGRK